MERRIAPIAALFVVLSLAGVAFAARPAAESAPLAAVGWPVSTLLVSEVQTGGASASDEFAEITNVGTAPVDLIGLELVYATSTGSTVTKKASWAASLMLGVGKHLLVANSAGIYGSIADATYTGGFAATGGAIVLRVTGGAPIDAVGWGDATNTFVEGSAAPAPAAGSSIERHPGGLSGNTLDTNSNSSDWFTQATPNPQNLAAPPVPAPGPTPTPTPAPTPTPTAAPTPTDGPMPTGTAAPSATPAATQPGATDTPAPSDSASPSPSATPTIEPTAAPTPEVTPTPEPTPTATPAPTPNPTAVPTPVPTASATPVPTPTPIQTVSILVARAQANGAIVAITGTLTTSLGALESGRKAFVQDDTAGIALYLDTAVVGGLPAGTVISVAGSVDDRFAERTLRVNVADIVVVGASLPPAARDSATGSVDEAVEGSLVMVHGVTVGSASALSDGLGIMVDDGSGQVRVIVGPDALGGLSVPSGTSVTATGPVGQRDSTGTGLSGYRIHATEAGSFAILPAPTPSVAPTPTPTASPAPTTAPTSTPTAAPTTTPTPAPTTAPTPTPAPTTTATPVPTATPTSTPAPSPPPTITIVEARGASIGAVVTVAGVVTAEGGRLGSPPLIAIADGTAGIAVRVPDGIATPGRGTTVVVKGALADPYGQLELRPSATGFAVTGHGSLPAALHLTADDLGEATEGRLAELTGTVTAAPSKGTSGDLSIDLTDAAGHAFRAIVDASSRIVATDLVKGHTYTLTGIVGQHASRKGALDGYRIYPRDRSDIVATGGPTASAPPTMVTRIAAALAFADGTPATIEGIVTAGASLLDSSGRRIVVQDVSGAIEVYLPSGTTAAPVGTTIRASGVTGHAWGAPRIAATTVMTIPGVGAIVPAGLGRAPGERDEWLLVRLSGTVLKVQRLGNTWHAELQLADGSKVPVQGQAGAGIPSTAVIAGRSMTVTGIVRRPYPTASDRRFSVLPRSAADVSAGPGANAVAGTGSSNSTIASGGTAASGTPAADITPDTDLAVLADHVGAQVRVGGVVARLAADGFDLDDGTAIARISLQGDMASLAASLHQGDAVAASGTVVLVNDAATVVVGNDGSLVRVGSLGQALPIGGGAEQPLVSDGTGSGAVTAADSVGLGGGIPSGSLLAMAGISILSVLATLLRRRLVKRRLRAVLVDRLAALRSRAS